MQRSEWDVLASKFDTHKNPDEIDPDAADNVLIAWPSVIEGVLQYFQSESLQGKTALDFGCGTGGFSQALRDLGSTTVGVDTSEEMLKVARETVGGVAFTSPDRMPSNVRYDLITGIMVFQFIENVQVFFSELVKHLRPGGLLAFAVFNPEFVVSCLSAKRLFSGFDSLENPKKGLLDFDSGVSIPTYVRTMAEYDSLLAGLGLRKQFQHLPDFTPEFLNAHPVDMPTDKPEYLILGYSLD